MTDVREIGIADVLELTRVGKATIYRWMNHHPTLETADPDSRLGHPFPKPARKQGREVLWEEAAVEAWWTANREFVGRHPDESNIVIMSWEKFRKATINPPRIFRNEDGADVVEDDLLMIESIDRKLGDVRLRFRSIEDAVWFKLRYG